ncbi:protein KRI1 homolog [Lethenteron reissneri]|uniref:protein KRI1 homolog n=1 Tax=Lethenteron reissneri TaxID=7753 RepID=UPI002AB622C6|nr:protein KRI1 homolog [Lethenteron reissneri]
MSSEVEEEELDYRLWLKGQAEQAEGVEDMDFLHTYWNDPSLDEGERFLKDYVLNRKYIDRDSRGDDGGGSGDSDDGGGDRQQG